MCNNYFFYSIQKHQKKGHSLAISITGKDPIQSCLYLIISTLLTRAVLLQSCIELWRQTYWSLYKSCRIGMDRLSQHFSQALKNINSKEYILPNLHRVVSSIYITKKSPSSQTLLSSTTMWRSTSLFNGRFTVILNHPIYTKKHSERDFYFIFFVKKFIFKNYYFFSSSSSSCSQATTSSVLLIRTSFQ